MAMHRKTLIVCGVLVVTGTWLSSPWGHAAPRVNPAVQGDTAVRTIQGGQRLGGSPGQRGATFYALESQTTRLTTRFAGAVAVAERGLDGHVQTTLSDLGGNEIGRFTLNHVDGTNGVLRYSSVSGKSIQALGDPSLRPTLHWVNRQAYSLWKDGADAGGASLEWQSGLMRPRGAPGRDLDRDIVELHTEWANGLTARTTRRSNVHQKASPARMLQGDVLISRLTKDGADVGVVNWFVRDQILAWDLPGLAKGYLAPEHLKSYGGWPFTPDFEWMNVQTIAFHHFKTLITKHRFVAGRQLAWPERVLHFFAPTVSANEEGCDDLHWLDGSMLRWCCDVHDACYSKNGCSSKSWWQVWTSWRCDYCNAWVVDCFLAGGDPIFMMYP